MASNDNWYTQGFLNGNVRNMVDVNESVGEQTDPLKLDIEDIDLATTIDDNITRERQFYDEKYNLYERRAKNEKYYFGRQISELDENGELKPYNSRNLDNVLYEIEATIKPLAMSQLPDLLVTPGTNTDQSKDIAQLLTTAVDSDIKKRQNRKVLAMAFKHLPVYFIGVIKVRWNPQLEGGLGDYEYNFVHPDKIDFDYTCIEADADKMKWVAELVSTTVENIVMQFPKKKEEFFDQLRKDGIMTKDAVEPDWKGLATPVDMREVWFTDYEKKEDDKWKRVEGVCWKYKDVILDKMKNPYFDYEGETQLFTYENPQLKSSRSLLTPEQMQQSLVTGIFPANVSQEKVYHNYFEMPRKPYFFMAYDQWGKQPMDETSRVEQNITNQDTLDTRGQQIEETLNNRGHHIWSKLSGLKPSDVQKMDHNNPNEDYVVDGKPGDVHEFIPAERPSPAEFQDQDRTQNRMYSISGSTAIRGTIVANSAATNNQIAREANYTRADDLVEDTINPASEWIAAWALQMIKVFYTQEHFRKIMGAKGEMVYLTLHQNLVEDGMEVMIKASGTDKIKRENNAVDDAKMAMIDPLSYMTDRGYDDPEGRAAKLIAFKTDMPLYISEFVEDGPTATKELAGKLLAISQQHGPQPGQVGGQASNPQQPTPTNTQAVPAQPPQGPPQSSPRSI